MKKIFWDRFSVICSVLVIFLIIGCFLPGSLMAQAALEKVKFGYAPAMTFAPVFLAIEKGYFKDQGLELELIHFTSGAKQIALMAAGEIDVGDGDAAAGVYNAMAEGVKIKMVADKGLIPVKAGAGTSVLVVRKDLADAMKTPADLKGKKILLMSDNSPHRFFMELLYQKYNMTEKDIEYIYMSFPQMPTALEKKQADAAYMVEPHGMRAIEAGAKEIARAGDIAPGHQVAVIFYPEIFLQKRPETAKKFMVAYIQGLRYFNKNKKSEETVDVLSRYTKVPKEVIMKIDPPAFSEDGRVNVDSIVAQQDWFYKVGLVKQKIKIEDFIDHSYVDYANKVLGPVK